MPDDLAPREAAVDPLVSSARKLVSDLADGNPSPASSFSFEGSRTDRVVRLTLRIDIDHVDPIRTLKGQVQPDGSTRCGDPQALAAFLVGAFRQASVSAEILEKVAATLRANPARSFADLEDKFEIGVTVGRCHVHLPCGPCGQTGFVGCGRCRAAGEVSCPSCNDGKRACVFCHGGQVHTTVRVRYPNAQVDTIETRYVRCSYCFGSGRNGSCYTCGGRQRVTCQACGGNGQQPCDDCGRTGWITNASGARLIGRPDRKLACEDGAPIEFRRAVEALSVKDVPVLHGKVSRQVIDVVQGHVGMGLECLVPHVVLNATFDTDIVQRFDAVGARCEMPTMPAFLDTLLVPLACGIHRAASEKRNRDVLRLAKDSRVTGSVLAAISRREGHSVEALCAVWKGAASEILLDELLDDLRMAYDGVGASATRGPWRLFALPVIAIAAAAFPLHLGGVLVASTSPQARGAEPLMTCALGLLPLAVVFVLARRRARRAVRTFVGSDAARAPRQGWWAKGTAIASVLALTAGAFGSGAVPPVPAAETFAQARPKAVGASRAITEDVPAGQLPPSPLPHLQPSFRISATRGTPAVFWLQFHLRQLGFLRAEPDGVMHPATTDALRRFNMSLPPSRKAYWSGWDAAATVAAALRDQFALQRLPSDRFPVPGLSNMARANLTAADTLAMRQAAEQAVSAPGRVIAWRSTDGERGGRLVATRNPSGCPSLQAEVEVRGQVDTAAPFARCGAPKDAAIPR